MLIFICLGLFCLLAFIHWMLNWAGSTGLYSIGWISWLRLFLRDLHVLFLGYRVCCWPKSFEIFLRLTSSGWPWFSFLFMLFLCSEWFWSICLSFLKFSLFAFSRALISCWRLFSQFDEIILDVEDYSLAFSFFEDYTHFASNWENSPVSNGPASLQAPVFFLLFSERN